MLPLCSYWAVMIVCEEKREYYLLPHTTVVRPLFLDHPGEPVPEEKLLDFMVQGKINRGRHTDHPAGRHSIRTKQCPTPYSIIPHIFYRPDALPAAQPTVSKHWILSVTVDITVKCSFCEHWWCAHSVHSSWLLVYFLCLFFINCCQSPFPQVDMIGTMVTVWRVRGKIIRSVLCSIVCNSCAQCNAHTYEQN